MSVCLSVCLSVQVFSAISKPIRISFDTNLLFTPGKVLKQYYLKNVLKKSDCPILYFFKISL